MEGRLNIVIFALSTTILPSILQCTGAQDSGLPTGPEAQIDECRKKTSTHRDKMDGLFYCRKVWYDFGSRLNKRTTVKFDFILENLNYDPSLGIYLDGAVILRWNDENFIWNPNTTEVPFILSRKVAGLWMPEIYENGLSNYASDKKLFREPVISHLTGGGVQITPSGNVSLYYETVLTALCPHQELKYFPYDVQTCRIELFTMQNISFLHTGDLFSPQLEQGTSFYQILEYNISTGATAGSTSGSGNSSVLIDVTFLRYDHMFWMKLFLPNLGLCILLLLPLWLPPNHMLRLILPTLSMFATIYQMQSLATMIPDSRVYSGDILMLDFYRNLFILSLLLLVHNFFSCLLHRRKVFLPAQLNRFYAKVYSVGICKSLVEMEEYLTVEKQESDENAENLEALFHTWSELLRLVDVFLLLLILAVEVASYVPTVSSARLVKNSWIAQ